MDLYSAWLLGTIVLFLLTFLGVIWAVKGFPGFLLFFGTWLLIFLVMGAYWLPSSILSQDNRQVISGIGIIVAFFGILGSIAIVGDFLGLLIGLLLMPPQQGNRQDNA